jgi:2-polyprenyl-3-methyl-5-hydroxy-6-metoxy-1,4-benzoquinol methylase
MNSNRSAATDALSPDSIRETAIAFQRGRVLLTAYELDLFTVLGEKNRSAIEVAKALGTAERATDRLMNTLCAMGLLEKKEGKFSNTPLSSKFLVKGKPDFMAGLMHTVHLWDTWSTLTQAVRHGRSVVARPIDERGEKWLTAFIAAMHERARRHAPALVPLLNLSGVSRVLDVGGGSGAYAMAFVRAREGISATVFDLPNVVPLTQGYIAEEGLSDRVETVVGDYNVDELGSGFDLVFLSAIIHSNSPEQNRSLIRKCSKALIPQGQVVVQDFIVDEDRTSPAFGALFALNMLVGTEAGDTFTESEVRAWMEEAGLSGVVRKDTDFGTTLIIGRKSEITN